MSDRSFLDAPHRPHFDTQGLTAALERGATVQLATTCLAFSYEGELAPAVAQNIADRLAVAYPGMEVLVWADPFMPVADRRSSAFEPAAVGGAR